MPERLAGRVPPIVVEIGVAVAFALIAVFSRAAFISVAADRAPYAFNFLAVVLAAVVAGWRCGLITLALSQFLAFVIIVTPQVGLAEVGTDRLAALILATFSELLVLLIIGLYQREVAKGVAEREKRLELLDEALREIDHRTRNNYQTVMAMIDLQTRRTSNDAIRDALRQVSERIQAIANASQQLAVRSADLGAIRLDDHLCGLVEQIGRGLSRDEIDVACEVDDVTASADKATSISIIVNELVTNAIKHAFNGEGSGHVRVVGRNGHGFELIVADDGRGLAATQNGRTGLGTKLVESFARQLGAKHEVTSTESGTTHRLLIPTLD